MQGQAQQQVYDRGATIFSPDGRLYQVEYVREATKYGTVSTGVRTPEDVVLVADKCFCSLSMESTSVEKTHKADDHIGIANAGYAADARQFIDFARRQSQVNRLCYGKPTSIETLTKEVTDHIQQYTQVDGARPFDVALLIGGVENGTPRLYEADPSRTPYEWKTASIGADRGDHREHLEENFRDDLTLDEGIELVLEATASTGDEGTAPDGVDVVTAPAETERFVELPNDEIESYLEANDLLATEDNEQTEE